MDYNNYENNNHAGNGNGNGDNGYNNPYRQPGQYGNQPYQNQSYQNQPYGNQQYQNGQFQNQPYQNGQNAPKKQKRQGGMGSFIAKCAVGAATFGLIASLVFTGVSYVGMKTLGIGTGKQASTEKTKIATTVTQTATGTAKDITDVSGIADEVMPSIVAITNVGTVTYQTFFGSQSQNYESAGSGIIIKQSNNKLYIVTNNHVVANATTLTVQFSDNTTAGAEVTGTDPSDDLAVIEVKLDSIEKAALDTIRVATIGDSKNMSVGQATIAIGNALGYGQSVTTGVVSALGRTVSTTDETTGQTITNTNLIQTDAAINPGNSGGALLNANGEVIGINSVKYADTEVEGIGYAIPMEDAIPVIEALINGDKLPQNAYLGIMGQDVSEDVASLYNMPEGVYISEVIEDSAAQKAGLKKGDIITAIDNTKLSSMSELKTILAGYKEGKEVTLTVSRMSDNGYVSSERKVTLGGTTSTGNSGKSGNSGRNGSNNGGNGGYSQEYGEDDIEEYFRQYFE